MAAEQATPEKAAKQVQQQLVCKEVPNPLDGLERLCNALGVWMIVQSQQQFDPTSTCPIQHILQHRLVIGKAHRLVGTCEEGLACGLRAVVCFYRIAAC